MIYSLIVLSLTICIYFNDIGILASRKRKYICTLEKYLHGTSYMYPIFNMKLEKYIY